MNNKITEVLSKKENKNIVKIYFIHQDTVKLHYTVQKCQVHISEAQYWFSPL